MIWALGFLLGGFSSTTWPSRFAKADDDASLPTSCNFQLFSFFFGTNPQKSSCIAPGALAAASMQERPSCSKPHPLAEGELLKVDEGVSLAA